MSGEPLSQLIMEIPTPPRGTMSGDSEAVSVDMGDSLFQIRGTKFASKQSVSSRLPIYEAMVCAA
jgi:hypothetical protein